MAEINENIIETVTEDGEKVKFEIFEIISVARKLGKTLAEEKAEIERRNVMGETV